MTAVSSFSVQGRIFLSQRIKQGQKRVVPGEVASTGSNSASSICHRLSSIQPLTHYFQFSRSAPINMPRVTRFLDRNLGGTNLEVFKVRHACVRILSPVTASAATLHLLIHSQRFPAHFRSLSPPRPSLLIFPPTVRPLHPLPHRLDVLLRHKPGPTLLRPKFLAKTRRDTQDTV